jgi:hypothetical protein
MSILVPMPTMRVVHSSSVTEVIYDLILRFLHINYSLKVIKTQWNEMAYICNLADFPINRQEQQNRPICSSKIPVNSGFDIEWHRNPKDDGSIL